MAAIISFLAGTAFLIAPNTFVMTDHQLGQESYHDVHVMQGTSYDVEPLTTECRTIKKGESVFAIGHIGGNKRLAVGEVTKVYGNRFDTTMLTHAGFSGGPVFDMDGDVIGVVTHRYMDANYNTLGNLSTSICEVL